ncbi:MAG: cytochrome c oxidase accessory protein CcoG [Pseudobdellovibrionaceae bacterium]
MNPSERLGMLDEHGHRKFIIPAEVKGFYTKWKRKVHFLLLLIFLLLPWIFIGGEQAFRIDLGARKLTFLGGHLYASDTPLMFFLLIIMTVGLALLTALYGRVWCGWACPQTVFIEAIYRQIEKWTEGTYLQRRRLRDQNWNFEKIRTTDLKWILYFFVSALIAHSFIASWSGSKELISMMSGAPQENWTYFLLVFGMTGTLLFNFGWFREQFCLIVCPYGKIQSVLMDSHSVTVMYDEKRGEPRKGLATSAQPKGDCVACGRCVQVCPTGIDIRNGVQMDCIGCTACIDACDEIMTKVKKPTGLIRYKALTNKPVQWLRARVLAYGGIIAAASVALIVLLAFHQSIRFELLRGKGNPYQVREENGKKLIQNYFHLRLENHSAQAMKIRIETDPQVKVVIPEDALSLPAEGKREVPIFFEIESSKLSAKGRLEIHLRIQDAETEKNLLEKKLSLLGPYSSGSGSP